jgi:hypothetical protein
MRILRLAVAGALTLLAYAAMTHVGSSFQFRSPTGDSRNHAEAKRRQEKEAAAGASA